LAREPKASTLVETLALRRSELYLDSVVALTEALEENKTLKTFMVFFIPLDAG
jgi:hypothetical protein